MSETATHLGTASRAWSTGVVVLVVGVVVCSLGGCRKPLFKEKDDRSPYARYDSVRGQDVPPYRYNEYGRRVPNLRARLAPKE